MKNGLDREHLEDGVMNRKSLPPDEWIEIPTLVVCGQTPYLSVREAPHNTESLQVGREETPCIFDKRQYSLLHQGLSFKFKINITNHRNEIKGGWVYIHGSLFQKKHILFIWIRYVRRYYTCYSMGLMTC